MNARTILLIVLTVGLAATSVALLRQLEIERDRAQAEASLRRSDQARIEELEHMRARLERQVQDLHAQLASLPRQGNPQEPASGPAARSAMADADATTAAQAGEPRMPAFRSVLADAASDPEFRKTLKTQQKSLMRHLYGDLIEQLGLSPEQAEAFLDVLVDQQLGGPLALRQSGGDPAAIAEGLRRAHEETNERLTALLGPLGVQQYESYQQTMGERMQAGQIASELEALDMPLRDDQRRQLISAMIEERQRVPPPAPEASLSPADLMQRHLQWQEDYDRRVRERVAQVLTPEQLEHFSQMQKLQTQMRRRSINTMKEGGAAFRGFSMVPLPAPGAAVAVDAQGVPSNRLQPAR